MPSLGSWTTPPSHFQQQWGPVWSSAHRRGYAAPARRLIGVSASDAASLPNSKQVLGTPRSCIKPSLCTSPVGSLAQSKPYNNTLGCESETKNNSVRKQISGSGCQGVITLNNRQSIISTVMRDVLTVSFQNGKQADRFRIKNTGKKTRKDLPRSSTRS